MTMTDTEAKALALVNEAAGGPVNQYLAVNRSASVVNEALCRAIEREAATEARHAAELRELKERFSEVAERAKDDLEEWVHSYPATIGGSRDTWAVIDALATFILPAPDPLAEAAKEAGEAIGSGEWTAFAEAQRVALSARGYEVRKIGEAGESPEHITPLNDRSHP